MIRLIGIRITLGGLTLFLMCWVLGLVNGSGIMRHMVAQKQWTLMKLCHSLGEYVFILSYAVSMHSQSMKHLFDISTGLFPYCCQYKLKRWNYFLSNSRVQIRKPFEFSTERNTTDTGAVVLMPVTSILCYLLLIEAAKGFSNYLLKITWHQEIHFISSSNLYSPQ